MGKSIKEPSVVCEHIASAFSLVLSHSCLPIFLSSSFHTLTLPDRIIRDCGLYSSHLCFANVYIISVAGHSISSNMLRLYLEQDAFLDHPEVGQRMTCLTFYHAIFLL